MVSGIFPSKSESLCLFVSLSVCQSVCLSVCLSICVSVCLSVCLSVYLSMYHVKLPSSSSLQSHLFFHRANPEYRRTTHQLTFNIAHNRLAALSGRLWVDDNPDKHKAGKRRRWKGRIRVRREINEAKEGRKKR